MMAKLSTIQFDKDTSFKVVVPFEFKTAYLASEFKVFSTKPTWAISCHGMFLTDF